MTLHTGPATNGHVRPYLRFGAVVCDEQVTAFINKQAEWEEIARDHRPRIAAVILIYPHQRSGRSVVHDPHMYGGREAASPWQVPGFKRGIL